MPFTGAFAFVVCPACNAKVSVLGAARVPDEVASPYPSAADSDRVVSGSAPPAGKYPLPSAADIGRIGPAPPSNDALTLRAARFAAAAATALVLFVLANNLVLLVAGAPSAVDAATGADHPVVSLFVITPIPVEVASLGGAAAAVWHIAMVAVIVASSALLLREHGPGALQHFARALMGAGSPRLGEHNGIFLTARFFCLSLFVTTIVVIGVVLSGGTAETPDWIGESSTGELLIALANASVWEEIVGRCVLLGLPLLAVHWAGRGKLDRPAWKYLAGGKFPLDLPALCFLFFSAAAFGIAHLSGWDFWKVVPSFVAGLLFGILYLRVGLHAAIVCHFLHDYFPVAELMGATDGYLLLLELVTWALLLVGAVHFIRYLFVVREVLDFGGVPPHLGGPELTAPEPAGGRWRHPEGALGTDPPAEPPPPRV